MAGVDDDSVFTPQEVARMFGVRTVILRAWERAGRLEARRTPGGHRRYTAASVRALLAQQSTPPTRSNPSPPQQGKTT